MFKNIKKNLLTLHCSSKAQKKELLKHLKLDTIKALCEYTIINRNIKGVIKRRGKATESVIRFENL